VPLNGYQILIASLPDRDSVVAEIYVGDAQFAEVRRDHGDSFHVEIYARPQELAWEIPYDDLVHLLAAARDALIGKVN
jgi:hypothetical protein